jgi:tRNA nucleotidyltransferase (CCA-adding enzyme)
MADDILLCLRSSNALRNQVVFLIAHHMTPFEPDQKILRRRLGSYGEATVKDLLALQKADYSSKGVDEGEDTHFAQVETLLSEILQEDACLTVKELAVSGTDLLSLGVQPGKHIGECMKHLLNLVQDESIPNNKEDLLCAAEDFFANNREESV